MRKIISMAVIFITVSFGLMCVSMYFSYNNREITLRNQAEAQRGVVEANFDAMWKIISQQAQVSTQYREAFKEIYPELISGRYANGNGQFMQWIKEANPEFDSSLYKTLMETIEVQRISFTKDQKRMLDIIREHKTLCETMPACWFIKNKTEIEKHVFFAKNTLSGAF